MENNSLSKSENLSEATATAYTTSSLLSTNGCIPPELWNDSLSGVALTVCPPNDPQAEKLRSILSNILSVLIAIIMVGIGCAVEFKLVIKHFKKPIGIVLGAVCQFVIMPLLGYAWAKIFVMEAPETLSLLLVGSCPGGTMSNIVAYWIGGDMELSSTMTTVSVVLSLGTLPLLLFIYSKVVSHSGLSVPFSTLGLTITLIVVPLSIGTFLRYKFPKAAIRILKVMSVLGIVALIIVAAFSIYLFHGYWSFETGQIVTSVLYPLCGMVLGYGDSYVLSGASVIILIRIYPFRYTALTSAVALLSSSWTLSHAERRTVSVETGIQNSQLAMAIVQMSGWSLEITGRVMVFPMMYAISQLCWSVVYVMFYHFISFAIHGKCPRHPGKRITAAGDPSTKEKTNDMVNPAFDQIE